MSSERFKNVGVVTRDVLLSTSGREFLEGIRDGRNPAPPFAASTGIWLSEVEHGRVVFEALPAEQFYNPLGTIHGGWVSGLLDSAMACAVHSTLPAGQGYTTVDLSINFVRAVMPDSGQLRCEGKVIHSGGRIATSEGRLWDASGKLLAHGTETCMIFKPEAK